MKKIILFTACICLQLCTGLQAQSDGFGIWSSTEVKKKIIPGLDASLEGEFRTRDGVKDVERWAVSPSLSYRLFPFLNASLGYSYINKRVEAETTKKGNYIPAYWSPRHRFSASLTGSCTWNRLEFSLRERFQFTRRTALSVPKYDGDDGSRKADEIISAKSKNMLRSRLQVAWNLRKSPFTPYASCELYQNMNEGWSVKKTRWTVGTEYKVNKKHSFDLYYRYQDHEDDDETNGHVLGIGYKFKF